MEPATIHEARLSSRALDAVTSFASPLVGELEPPHPTLAPADHDRMREACRKPGEAGRKTRGDERQSRHAIGPPKGNPDTNDRAQNPFVPSRQSPRGPAVTEAKIETTNFSSGFAGRKVPPHRRRWGECLYRPGGTGARWRAHQTENRRLRPPPIRVVNFAIPQPIGEAGGRWGVK
jgi:hypothetical protein